MGNMKTMTDEVDASVKTKDLEGKWYFVRPVLLSVLIAETLSLVGLALIHPDPIRYWLGRMIENWRVGLPEIEITLITLALITIAILAIRSRSTEGFKLRREGAPDGTRPSAA